MHNIGLNKSLSILVSSSVIGKRPVQFAKKYLKIVFSYIDLKLE